MLNMILMNILYKNIMLLQKRQGRFTSLMILQPLTLPICENRAHNKSSETA